MQSAFRLSLSGKGAPPQNACCRAQIVEMPMARGRAVEMPVQAGPEAGLGAAGIGVVTPREALLTETADGQDMRGVEPEEDDVSSTPGERGGFKTPTQPGTGIHTPSYSAK